MKRNLDAEIRHEVSIPMPFFGTGIPLNGIYVTINGIPFSSSPTLAPAIETARHSAPGRAGATVSTPKESPPRLKLAVAIVCQSYSPNPKLNSERQERVARMSYALEIEPYSPEVSAHLKMILTEVNLRRLK